MNKCPECYPDQPSPWYEQPMNEEIREYARKYILRPVVYYFTLSDALDEWGENFDKRDYE